MPKVSSAKSKENIGKGIRSLLKNIDKNPTTKGQQVDYKSYDRANDFSILPINQVVPNPNQPRKDFDDKSLMELVSSVKTHAIIQPITVKKISVEKFMIISGERRWRAAKMAGLKTVPAFFRTVDDQGILEMALMENIQRQDLNAIEVALSLNRLIEECDLTQEKLAERIGKDRTTITNYLRLLKLPPNIQLAVRKGDISMGHARTLISIEQTELQLHAFADIQSKNLSVRQAEKLVKTLTGSCSKEKPKSNQIEQQRNRKIANHINKVQNQLSTHFGAKTTIDHQEKNNRGKITIEYHSVDEMNNILQKLGIITD